MKIERALKIRDKARGWIANIFRNAARFHWTHKHICEILTTEVWGDGEIKRCPSWVREYLRGYVDRCFHEHWRLVVFSYVVHGKRLSIESDEYRKVSPEYVNKVCSESGAFAYRDSLDDLFTVPDESRPSRTNDRAAPVFSSVE